MQYSTAFSLLFFLILALQVSAQFTSKFEHLGGKYYAYDSDEGKLHEFAGVFSLDPETDYLFKKFDQHRRGQRTANHVSLALLGVANIGAVAIATSGNGDEGLYLGLYVWFFGNTAAVLTTVLGNLIAGNAKGNFKREMLDRVNSRSISYKKPQLQLQMGQYGLGLALKF